MKTRMRNGLKWMGVGLIGVIGVAFIAGEFMLPTENTSAKFPQVLPGEANEALAAACQDCHSDRVSLPWYSHVPFVSLLVAYDVREGREHLNFSHWDRVSAEKRADWIHESAEHVAEGDMPPKPYLLLHPEARRLDVLQAALNEAEAAIGGGEAGHVAAVSRDESGDHGWEEDHEEEHDGDRDDD